VRISLQVFAAMVFTIGSTLPDRGQASQRSSEAGQTAQPAITETPTNPAAPSAQELPVTDPVADPKAVVTLGKARFTVLTPQLIRMEWAADSKFEDHASFVFINRHLPVPKFDAAELGAGDSRSLSIKTSALTLHYSASGDGKFTLDNLSI